MGYVFKGYPRPDGQIGIRNYVGLGKSYRYTDQSW